MRTRLDICIRFVAVLVLLVPTVPLLTAMGAAGEPQEIAVQGTVEYIALSGGFHGIVTDDGEQFLPLNLDPAFEISGLRVAFTARREPDAMTVFMWGTPIWILSMQIVPDGTAELAAANTGFALALYDQLRRGEDGNMILSPLSVSAVLAMTFAGAGGETAQQMADVLRFTLLGDRLQVAFQGLLEQLNGDGTLYDLSIAHSLWGQAGYGFLETFTELARIHYGAGLHEIDFCTDPEAARREINDWVADRTRQRIIELLSQGTVDAATRLVLVNAIYLLAAWERPFSPESTSIGSFTLSSGESILVSLMTQTAIFPYACLETVQVLELPYEGEDLSLLVVLPASGTPLSDVEALLTPDALAEWIGALAPTNVTVHLPPFRLRTAISLRDVLVEMGMPLAFSDAADFSGLAGGADLSIDDVVHEAFVEVDEKGTEAAAATAVVIRVTSLPLEPVSFRADRPFLFLVRHRATGSVLFLGRLVHPLAPTGE